MSVAAYDQAVKEVNRWRGRCIDLYSRAEVAVAAALLVAAEKDATLAVRHLAGQRLADLVKVIESSASDTEKQKAAVLRALREWEVLEAMRVHYAHGVMTVLLDRESKWHVQLDFTRYGKAGPSPHRWNRSEKEAKDFEAHLEDGFRNLSAQLGQFRKRLAAT